MPSDPLSDGPSPRRRDFRLLLFGQTTSQLGAQVSTVAVPLLAVTTLHASPSQLGLVTASGTLAFALIGLPAGAWIDRWRRRPVLVAGDVARAVLLTSIPLSAFLGTLTIAQLVLVSLLTGVARVFFDIGYQSYLPSVVGERGLLSGNASMEAVRAGGQLVGPGLGGWATTLVGAANVVLFQAVTFGLSAASLLAIRTPEPAPSRPPHGDGMVARIRQGVTFIWRTRVLRATLITSVACNFSFAMASAVSFIFLVRTLGLPPAAIGFVLAAGSVMVMIGALVTPRLARRFGSARVVWLSLAVTGPVTLLGPLARPGWQVSLLVVATAAGELGQIVYAITNVTLRQRLCPAHLLGRVNATMRFFMMGPFPLGALLGGVLGEAIGLRATLWAAAAVIVLSPSPIWLALRGIRETEDLH
ncbi:putative MFS family arabinose efflux permease [Nonomuraea fuscirosea]|uniref:Putative MFS family arabinose efflux permease n=1 Tax=Nonomuraea fuscirosea TaxID=1291556 RepID=A0A2T0N1T6_9ACTN|nr:MFS transporter [Nonomuraea fuscirosea]PRX65911.1 putative MFS family arabinose efflux permease [Nonomuraea fuscirosea]